MLQLLFPLRLLLSSAFATIAKPIYQPRLILGFAGIELLLRLGRHLSHISLLVYFSFALVPNLMLWLLLLLLLLSYRVYLPPPLLHCIIC